MAPCHAAFKWVNTTLANLETSTIGTFRAVRKKHAPRRLDEFVFRFNRRARRHSGCLSLLKIAAHFEPATDKMLIAPEPGGSASQ